ncbi:hypothetical protein N7455_001698 [Penicillium solitum]|uniref:uncharacterized protein n=1 Tax=Penicillium solitum TaxID=60172 RepID=UPI0032C46501|nr:hypothetical protein N7536_005811 [Penicillium majusculum]KAJ5878233.1 hypothetical protein N7455_001698 [Penicillium solitum]
MNVVERRVPLVGWENFKLGGEKVRTREKRRAKPQGRKPEREGEEGARGSHSRIGPISPFTMAQYSAL